MPRHNTRKNSRQARHASASRRAALGPRCNGGCGGVVELTDEYNVGWCVPCWSDLPDEYYVPPGVGVPYTGLLPVMVNCGCVVQAFGFPDGGAALVCPAHGDQHPVMRYDWNQAYFFPVTVWPSRAEPSL